MKLYTILIGFLLFSACEKEASQKPESSNPENTETTQVVRITKKEVEAIDFLDYGLSSTVKNAVIDWNNYTELQSLIASINNGDLSYFESDDEVMASFIKELKSGIPEKVKNQSVMARLTALETKFYKLKSAIKITNTLKEELTLSIKEFFEACSNLNLQMNKKLEKETQDISKPSL